MKVTLKIPVQANSPISHHEIANLVRRLIDAGLSDAADTIENGEGDVAAAERATQLRIGAPVVAATPRVLVIVQEGVANPVADDGVDIEVFDWDNYRDDPQGTGGVPARFADLAQPYGIPID